MGKDHDGDIYVEDYLGALIVCCLSLTALLTILCYRNYRTKKRQRPPNSTARGVEEQRSKPHRRSHLDVLLETLCVLFVNSLVLFVIQVNGFFEAKWAALAVVCASFLVTVAWVFVNTSPWGVKNANSEPDDTDENLEEQEDASTPSFLMDMKQRLSPGNVKNKKIPFEESNHLGDFEYDVYRALLLALGQFLLLTMYVAGILEAKDEYVAETGGTILSRKEARFYMYGILIQIAYVVGLDKFKETISMPLQWAFLFAAAREGHELVVDGADEDDIEKGFRKKLTYGDWVLWVSFLFVTGINIAGFLVILVCLPVQLSYSESRVDFVLNSIAAFFLVEIDDLGGTKKFWALPVSTTSTEQKGQSSSMEDVSEMESFNC